MFKFILNELLSTSLEPKYVIHLVPQLCLTRSICVESKTYFQLVTINLYKTDLKRNTDKSQNNKQWSHFWMFKMKRLEEFFELWSSKMSRCS